MVNVGKSIFLLALCTFVSIARAVEQPAVGSTRVARWQDDRTAAFELMFDDGCPSHWQIAIPELVKRGLIGAFYLNPGKAEFTKFRGGWETNYWKLGMVYADHTMTHRGVHSLAEAEKEIGDCAAIIRTIVPPDASKLLSYGQPGVGPNDWTITGAELGALLKVTALCNVFCDKPKGPMACPPLPDVSLPTAVSGTSRSSLVRPLIPATIAFWRS